MLIQILTKTFSYTNKNSIIFPFFAFKKILNNENFFFKILFDKKQLIHSDFIIIDSKYHREDWAQNQNKIYEDFIEIKNYTNKIIYFDTTDSTGMVQAEILDYIDEYWKSQILKNKVDYHKEFYGGRIFSEFYNSRFNIFDKNEIFSKFIDKKKLNKIKVAWNFGLADYSYLNKYLFYLRKFFLNEKFFFYKKKKNIKKKLDFFAAFNYNYSRETISFQRKQIRSLLGNNFYERINDFKYHKLIESSKVVLSPFGWGELAYRDFEAFHNNCLLLKPNIDHLETWPDFFKKNETYIDFNWDLSDLMDKIENIKLKQDSFNDISINGYNIYNKYTSGIKAGDYFLDRIKNLLNE